MLKIKTNINFIYLIQFDKSTSFTIHARIVIEKNRSSTQSNSYY